MVKREAKYEGLQDNTVTVSLVNWALPYAQRYIFTLHHEKYTQTKKTVHSQVKRLQVFVANKLCYRNVIPQYGISSKKEFKCSSLLQVCLISFVFLAIVYSKYNISFVYSQSEKLACALFLKFYYPSSMGYADMLI